MRNQQRHLMPKSVKLGNKAYESLCAANGFTYVPLVVDTYGAWDPSCFQFFKSIANSHAVVHEYHPSFSLRLLLSLLSVTLQTHVAASLLSGRSIPQVWFNSPSPLPYLLY